MDFIADRYAGKQGGAAAGRQGFRISSVFWLPSCLGFLLKGLAEGEEEVV